MITALSLENVRVFDRPGFSLTTAPLTVICGTNSSGKSTLLKSIVLLGQTQSTRLGSQPGRLRLLGPEVDLGDYHTLVSHNDMARAVKIGIEIEDELRDEDAQFLLSLKADAPAADVGSNRGSRTYRLRSEFRFCAAGKDGTSTYLKDASFDLLLDDRSVLHWAITGELHTRSDDVRTRYHIHMPRRYYERVGGPKIVSTSDSEYDGYVRAEAVLSGILPIFILAKSSPERSHRYEFIALPPHLSGPTDDLGTHLQHLSYLGPLRAPAQRYYVSPPGYSPDPDPEGKHIPYLLGRRQKQMVWNYIPGRSKKPSREPLSAAVDAWLGYLRTGAFPPHPDERSGRELTIDRNDVLLECRLRTPGGDELHALADSGFGYSQVMPILIRALLLRPNAALLIEQPELHLNPALQIRVAEFIVAMARAGKQIVLETHSEHLVNALRLFVAEDESGVLGKMSQVQFLDYTCGAPELQSLKIEQDGTIPNWPSSFFGETLEISTRLLRAQRRFLAGGHARCE